MRIIKWLIGFLVLFVILPAILTVVLFKYTATPLTNWILAQRVNAPAKVEKVDTNWLLTHFKVLNLEIDNPEGFKEGKMLQIPEADITLNLKTYITFQPYLILEAKKMYFYFERKSDNSTNVAVAFNLPYQKGRVSPLRFNIHDTDVKLKVQTLKDVKYQAHGWFKGFYNNAEFKANGYGDFSQAKPFTHTEFTVYDWKITNEQLEKLYKKLPVLQPIIEQLKQVLGVKELTFSKIWGIVETKGDLVIFKGLKIYVVDNKLFAEIKENSTYNRASKALNIKGVIYIPTKVEFEISGTTENPKVDIKGVTGIIQNINQLLPQKGQSSASKETKEITEKLEETKKNIEETVNKTKEELEKTIENVKKLIPIH